MGEGEITPATRVPLGWVIAGFAFVAVFTATHFGTLFTLRSDISIIKSTVDRLQDESWSRQHQEIFALRLRLMNSNIVVPDVTDIRGRK